MLARLLWLFLGGTLMVVATDSNIFVRTLTSDKKNNTNIINNNNTNITVGVFYYPWHTKNFHGRHYLRGALTPPQAPALGEYDQRNASVISQHLAWSRQANVRVWFNSWWGPNSTEDIVIRTSILTNPDLGDFKIAILYETMGRLGKNNSIANFYKDMKYMAQTYFGHPNYYRIQNRPVVFIYVTRYLRQVGILDQAIAALRTAALEQGYNLYIIGDHVFKTYDAGEVDNTTCTLMDALGTYDVYGSMGSTGYAKRRPISLFGRRQKAWRAAAHAHGCAFIPSISPGFNDRGVRSGHAPLARQILAGKAVGSLFRALLRQSLPMIENDYARTGNLLLVTSWNEWHEDTQIEPTATSPGSVATNLPVNLTDGIKYNSYGTIYLDILSRLTVAR